MVPMELGYPPRPKSPSVLASARVVCGRWAKAAAIEESQRFNTSAPMSKTSGLENLRSSRSQQLRWQLLKRVVQMRDALAAAGLGVIGERRRLH
jgi:hypothetical protein